MKKAIAILITTAAALAAQAPAHSGRMAAKPVKKAAAPQPLAIPKNATVNADGTYTWKDAQGKTWLFANTPFGVIKTDPNQKAPGASDTPAGPMANVKATVAGDKVRFERSTPFGPIKWEKDKTELTDDERALVDGQTTKRTSGQD